MLATHLRGGRAHDPVVGPPKPNRPGRCAPVLDDENSCQGLLNQARRTKPPDAVEASQPGGRLAAGASQVDAGHLVSYLGGGPVVRRGCLSSPSAVRSPAKWTR